MTGLKVLTAVMGVLIVVGVAVVTITIVHRATAPRETAPWQARLDEPAGSTIAGIAPAGPALAVLLRGGGADRVVLVDPRTGGVGGRVTLGVLPTAR